MDLSVQDPSSVDVLPLLSVLSEALANSSGGRALPDQEAHQTESDRQADNTGRQIR